MFNLAKLLETIPVFGALISALIGFGLVAMFRPGCRSAECERTVGPPVKEIHRSVYQYGNKCVQFIAGAQECPKGGKAIEVVETAQFE